MSIPFEPVAPQISHRIFKEDVYAKRQNNNSAKSLKKQFIFANEINDESQAETGDNGIKRIRQSSSHS